MSAKSPSDAEIAAAAEAIRRGELVLMPTETVYGLACNALDEAAIEKVFRTKGRPADNPLIVHVASIQQARELAAVWPEAAERLARAFWPGALTLVLPKRPQVPDRTTAGLTTVALRMPGHPVALRLIEQAEVPVAAPSANPFAGLSPTRVEHVTPDVKAACTVVLDAGPCRLGIESTVVGGLDQEPRILRPGGVSREEIERVLGRRLSDTPRVGAPRESPGQYPRHYAPRVPLRIVAALGPEDVGLTFHAPEHALQVRMPLDPAAYAALLYDALHRLEEAAPAVICVEEPPDGPDWEAVRDRLRKASATEGAS